LKPAASPERWWNHIGDAAAIERRIALAYAMQSRHEPF
jgi:hypothetical protein